LRLTCEGEDNLGKFTVLIPGHCGACGQDTDTSILYKGALKMRLKEKGIEPNSLILFDQNKLRHIGVTCGCYAKLQRQIAHISNKRSERSTARKAS
jgi:hypothetical protein